MWLWVVLIIAAFWFVGWGWGGYGGWWWGGRRPGIVGNVRNGANNGPVANNTPATYGAPPNGAVSTNPANDKITGSGLEVLQSSDKEPYVGKAFQLANAPVIEQVNNHVFWVGRDQADRILVVTNEAGASTSTGNTKSGATSTNGNTAGTNANGKQQSAAGGSVAQGNLVDVLGTVEKAPPESKAKQEWGLGQNGAQRVHQEGVYVMASSIEPVTP